MKAEVAASELLRVWPLSVDPKADPAEKPVWRLSACRNLRQRSLAGFIWMDDVLLVVAHLAHLLSTLFRPRVAFAQARKQKRRTMTATIFGRRDGYPCDRCPHTWSGR